ncbi:hypothetical protein [Alteromonas sp. H39]|uniref:hypothetical protein n=1 Tax=Alteromonas sp. H39 TaxID=3389876 RepID=UPI0039E06AA7
MIINTSFSINSADQLQNRPNASAVESVIEKVQPEPDKQQQTKNSQQQIVKAPSSDKDYEQAEQYQQFIREESNTQSRSAIATYNALAKADQRDNVREMFGVDIYA